MVLSTSSSTTSSGATNGSSSGKMLGHRVTRFWVMNSYLVPEEDGLTAVDTGMPGSADAILRTVEALGHSLRRVVLTHAHSDHVGSLDALVARLPDIEIACSQQTARFLLGEMDLQPGQPPLKGGFVQCSALPTRTLTEGERVGSLRVIAASGHSPDQIALLDERDGTLYAGDAFQTQGGLAVAGDLRWRFPLPAWATWHKSTALESARKLQALQPRRLAVGHGPVLEKPDQALQRAIARAEEAFHA